MEVTAVKINRRNTAATDGLIEAVHGSYVHWDVYGNQIGRNVTLWWEENG